MKNKVKSYSIATVWHEANDGERYALLENYCEPDDPNWSKDWKVVRYYEDQNLAHSLAGELNRKLKKGKTCNLSTT